MFLQVCPVCEHRNPRGSRFCNECGSPLQLRFCPACHAAEDVMALECRSCGEKLPLVAVTDASVAEVTAPPPLDNLWKPSATEWSTAFHLPDDAPVTVHGGATAAPIVEIEPPPVAPDPEAEPSWRVEPVIAKLNITGLTLIERLQRTQPEIELRTGLALPPEAARETAPAAVELTPESESEIEVSAEAETLVEASFAPMVDETPELVVSAEPVAVEDIGSQLRESAWRSALVDDRAPVTVLAPAVIHRPAPAARRLSLQRVGLVVATLGVLGAAVYSTRLAPGDTTAPEQAAAQPPAPAPAAAPALRAAEGAPPAAGVAVAAPAESVARTTEAPPPAPVAEQRTAESKESVDPPAPAAKPPPRRTAAAAVTPAETFVAPPAQARRIQPEPARPCTPAIAALGLCTLEPREEGN